MTATVEALATAAARIVGLGLLGGFVGGVAAAVYRWYARVRAPVGVPLLLSLATVGLYLNTSDALGQVLGGQRGVFDPTVALVNVLTFVAAGIAAPVAGRAGDRLATSVAAATGAREVEGELSRLVRSVGRVITVDLPEEIEDIEAYDPVPAERKAELAGKTLLFPRRLTVDELRERFAGRLKADYGIGHVDVDLTEDGTVEYLAVGSRVAGIGPTLPPRTVALAVRADPAFSAGPGDLVQVWRPAEQPERVVTAELRGKAGDVATLALDESEIEALDASTQFRLVTLPSSPRADHEFAGLLRAADETMEAITVGEGSDLDGRRLGDVGVAVVAVRSESGVDALPPRDRSLSPGDVVYAVARPENLREVERAAVTDRDRERVPG